MTENTGQKITVKVQPGAKVNAVLGYVDIGEGKQALKVSIKAPPEDGKANEELIKFLAKTWSIPKANIDIIAGHSSRIKTVAVTGVKNIY